MPLQFRNESQVAIIASFGVELEIWIPSGVEMCYGINIYRLQDPIFRAHTKVKEVFDLTQTPQRHIVHIVTLCKTQHKFARSHTLSSFVGDLRPRSRASKSIRAVDSLSVRYVTLPAMDTQAKARYSAFRERDWNILGYQEISYYRLYEADPEGDIHPIFQYTVPGRSSPIWPFFSQQEYQSHLMDLGPVFRLATKLLLSPSSLDFFYWLIYSPRTAVEPPVWNSGERVLEYRRYDKPEDDRRDESRKALDRFALTHRITFGELQEDAAKTIAMFSFARDDQGINIMDDSQIASGMPSWIILSQKYLDQLARLRAGGLANRLKIFNLRFKMAVTSIHELAVSTPNLMRCALML